MNFVTKLCMSGAGHLDDDAKNRVILTNQVAIVLSSIAFPYIGIFYFISPIVGLMVIPTVISLISVVALNYFRKHNASRLMLIASANLAVLYFASVVGRNGGVQQLYFAFIGMPVILFGSREHTYNFIGIALPFLCQLILELSDYRLFGPIYPSIGFQRIIYLTAVFAVLTIIVLYLRFAISRLEQSRIELGLALTHLRESRSTQSTMANQMAYAELVRNISHEFKNPIAMMFTRCELVKKNISKPEVVEKFADMMLRNLKRLDSLIKPMLDYGVSNSQLTIENVSTAELLNDLYELSYSRCHYFNIELTVDTTTDYHIWGDRDYIFQALINLISNSIQFTPPGGKIGVSLQKTPYTDPSERNRNGILIRVEDSGSGISPENLKRIFDPYFTTSSESKNAGLGLSIMFRVVTENEGIVRVKSTPGVGTQFDIILPEAP